MLERRTMLVLVVEDEILIRVGLRGFLESEGHEVAIAADAPAASHVLSARAGEIDLVVTDVMIPGGGGGAVAREARRRDPGLPVLFISAHPRDLLVEAGHIPYGARLLQKPFDKTAFMAAVEAAPSSSRCASDPGEDMNDLDGNSVRSASRRHDTRRR